MSLLSEPQTKRSQSWGCVTAWQELIVGHRRTVSVKNHFSSWFKLSPNNGCHYEPSDTGPLVLLRGYRLNILPVQSDLRCFSLDPSSGQRKFTTVKFSEQSYSIYKHDVNLPLITLKKYYLGFRNVQKYKGSLSKHVRVKKHYIFIHYEYTVYIYIYHI